MPVKEECENTSKTSALSVNAFHKQLRKRKPNVHHEAPVQDYTQILQQHKTIHAKKEETKKKKIPVETTRQQNCKTRQDFMPFWNCFSPYQALARLRFPEAKLQRKSCSTSKPTTRKLTVVFLILNIIDLLCLHLRRSIRCEPLSHFLRQKVTFVYIRSLPIFIKLLIPQ